MKMNELRKKNLEELNIGLLNFLYNQLKLRIQINNGHIQQVHLLKQIRRDIARIKTILKERTQNEY